MSYQQRAKVVAQFCSDPEYRVLIMSSVGSVGLNLTVAHVIIFVVRFLVIPDFFSLSIVRARPSNGVPKMSCKLVAASGARGKKRRCSATIYSQMRRRTSSWRLLLAANTT